MVIRSRFESDLDLLTGFRTAGPSTRLTFRLFGQKNRMNVRKDSALTYGDAGQQFVEFLVISDGELQMSGNYTTLFVIAGGISRQLQHLSRQVLQNCSQIDGSAGAHSLRIIAFQLTQTVRHLSNQIN